MKKIAVVEDNADSQLLIRAILEDYYEIIEYQTEAQAIEGIKKVRPDLVLLDISLPEMDGTEVLQQLRADSNLNHIPVIALTAHALAGDREKYLAAGFNDYVPKPILADGILLAAIERWLRSGN